MTGKCNLARTYAEMACNCLFTYHGECVIYRCPGKGEITQGADGGPLLAVIGDTSTEVQADQRVHICVHTRSWFLKVCDLVWDGELFRPRQGDELVWIDPKGHEQVWDLGRSLTEGVWRHHDRYENCIRVNSKLCEHERTSE